MTVKNQTGPAPRNRTLTSLLIRWRILTEAVKDHLADLPYAAAQNARLDKLVAEILSSAAEQKALTARLRVVIREREAKVEQARDLRSRLTAAVIGRYGPRSEKLKEFGLKPQRRRKRAARRQEVHAD
jgi:hypothetical protein